MSLGRVALGLTLLGSVGCATLRPVHDPAEFITRNHPRVVVITYLDNSSLYVAEPRVSGDSLFVRGLDRGERGGGCVWVQPGGRR